MFKVALKNLLGHKLRTLFTAVAVALGVAFMAGTFVLTDTVSASFDTIFTDAFSGIDAQVRGEEAFQSSDFAPDQRPDIDLSVVDDVRAVDGVAVAEPVVQSIGSVLDDDGGPLNPNGASFGANWTGVPAIDVFTVEEGRAPTGPTEAVIDEATASAGDFAVGDTIGVQTIKGRVDLEVSGIVKYGDSGNLGGASFVLMDTPAAIETFSFGGKIQSVVGHRRRRASPRPSWSTGSSPPSPRAPRPSPARPRPRRPRTPSGPSWAPSAPSSPSSP